MTHIKGYLSYNRQHGGGEIVFLSFWKVQWARTTWVKGISDTMSEGFTDVMCACQATNLLKATTRYI